MGTASLRLHDGTVVSARFDDNADGQIQADEKSRAQSALRAELVRLGRSGSEVDAAASIFILEDGTNPSSPLTRETTLPVGDLARTGTVRLFGANPARTTAGVSDPAMWAPTETVVHSDGSRSVIYHEADRWDETTAARVAGRDVRVDEDGKRYISTPGTGSAGSTRVWYPLDEATIPYPYRSGETHIPRLPYIPPERIVPANQIPQSAPDHDVSATAPLGSVTPRAWQFAIVRDGYQYYQAPGGNVARRSIANPDRDEVMVSPGGGQDPIAGAVWRAADDADAVPNRQMAVVGSGPNAQTYTLTAASPPTSADGAFDLFTGLRNGSTEPMTFRRPHGNATAPFEAQQGANWVNPTTISTAPVVTVGSGAAARPYSLAPADPATAGGYDIFTGTVSGSSVTLTLRRRHGVDNAPYEVQQGARWVAPETYRPTPARPQVGGGGGGRHVPSRVLPSL